MARADDGGLDYPIDSPGADARHLTMFDLVRHALRFQPDRLILGESRGEEMAAVCKALMTGHDGSMTTIHAEDAELAIDQAVQYVMENSVRRQRTVARRVVEQAVHVVVHIANQGGRRRITGVVAVERGSNHKWVYRQADSGGLVRATDLIGDLGRLAPRLRAHLAGDEVPQAMTVTGALPELVILITGIAVIIGCGCAGIATILGLDPRARRSLPRKVAVVEHEKDVAAALGWRWRNWIALRTVVTLAGILIGLSTRILAPCGAPRCGRLPGGAFRRCGARCSAPAWNGTCLPRPAPGAS